MIGWHNNNETVSYTALTHAIYFASGGNFVIYEDGSSPNDPADTWTVGQEYRVRIILNAAGGASYYYSTDGGRNWTTLWAGDATPTTTPLKVGTSYHSGTFEVDNWEIYSAAGPDTIYGDRGNINEIAGNITTAGTNAIEIRNSSDIQIDASGARAITSGGGVTMTSGVTGITLDGGSNTVTITSGNDGDVALAEMAAYRPKDEEAFLRINGVGQRKLERYGEDFIAAIIDFG